MDLLPTAVDVTKDIGRVERKNQKGEQTEDRGKGYYGADRRLICPIDLLIAFPKKEQQTQTEKPREDFSSDLGMDFRSFYVEECR